jgi:hypothetical protein
VGKEILVKIDGGRSGTIRVTARKFLGCHKWIFIVG